MSKTTPHQCEEWKKHENGEFNMHTEVIEEGSFLVFDTFTEVTPKEFKRKHSELYDIPIKYCPFCGKTLNN